jgi:hypothetical protein
MATPGKVTFTAPTFRGHPKDKAIANIFLKELRSYIQVFHTQLSSDALKLAFLVMCLPFRHSSTTLVFDTELHNV